MGVKNGTVAVIYCLLNQELGWGQVSPQQKEKILLSFFPKNCYFVEQDPMGMLPLTLQF